MYYQLSEKLTPTTFDHCLKNKEPFVAVLNPEEWLALQHDFGMGIDIDFNVHHASSTKAEVNLDSLTGTFKIPKKDDLLGEASDFSFVLDQRGIIFIDQHNDAGHIVKAIQKTKKWKHPSLERFLYDFLEYLIKGDLELLESYDKVLDQLEEDILNGKAFQSDPSLNQLRRKLTKLNLHYGQLIDLSQEFYENDNNFFQEDQLRFFHLFSQRVSRLESTVLTLRETIVQIRELSKSQLEMKQNKIMATLTIVTTSCMPLTILVGWYGMNFKYMPELNSVWGYPFVIGFAITLFISSILFVKLKKWL
ncbi:magnesium transporter CorA [Streptococcus iniae]|uniref:magnesium transporter CorA family protein n=1 Tax=Streptococcus iniae TaxID=1346 RepID=UPI000B5DD56D|nr:CorA family divalent cation transporter [Streptococcus iniae]ASL34514.1 CorA-like Mg2+ transporter protein [Streptococcus iniae]RLU33384.1 magnesium transporter CorA [Streptococcus iniae]RLU46081.1 magnesium transporter CorA [Streptococcus iniae]RLU48254.1 magnesium transporter CorA [Streptococcus iniae]RLU55409.1 magnesium transporter CorA [Streptococcus iniae]